MARKRMIDPSFWGKKKVSRLTFRQRLLSLGLVSNADDYGRMPAEAPYVRAQVFPYDSIPDVEIEADLDALEATGLFVRYCIDDSTFLQLISWNKYQRVDKPGDELIPPPPGWHYDDASKQWTPDSQNDSENGSACNSGSGSRLKERKGRERKGRERKGSEFDRPDDSHPSNPVAELVEQYQAIPGINAEKQQFSFIGRLRREFGHEQVLAAINDLAYKAEAGKLPDNPLVYLRGMVKKATRDSPRYDDLTERNRRLEAAMGGRPDV